MACALKRFLNNWLHRQYSMRLNLDVLLCIWYYLLFFLIKIVIISVGLSLCLSICLKNCSLDFLNFLHEFKLLWGYISGRTWFFDICIFCQLNGIWGVVPTPPKISGTTKGMTMNFYQMLVFIRRHEIKKFFWHNWSGL